MRKWNARKLFIVAIMSNSPIAAIASDEYVRRCLSGQDLHQSAGVKFTGYRLPIEQRVKKLEDVVFSQERNYAHS